MPLPYKLEKLETGQVITIQDRTWRVAEKEVYQESARETDIQWTLNDTDTEDEFYLILSQSKTGAEKACREVILTTAIDVDCLHYADTNGSMVAFSETMSLPGAPKSVQWDKVALKLDDETSDKAVDDDGNRVTRLTWDYYDPFWRKNVAIEVWKEDDADYYEAYAGDIILESSISLTTETSPLVARRRSGKRATKTVPLNLNLLTTLAWGIPAAFFGTMLISSFTGIPVDDILFIMVPAGFFTIVHRRSKSEALWVGLWTFIMVLAIIPLMHYRMPLGAYLAAFLAGGYFLPRFFGRFLPEPRAILQLNGGSWAAFLALWFASFVHYFKFAPAPHAWEEFVITLAIPLIGGILYAVIYRLAGRSL